MHTARWLAAVGARPAAMAVFWRGMRHEAHPVVRRSVSGTFASARTRCCSCCRKPSHDCRLQRRHRPRRLAAWHRCVAVVLICGVACCSALGCAPPRAFGMPVADCAEAAIMAIGFDIALGESRRPWFYNSTAAPCVASHPRLYGDDARHEECIARCTAASACADCAGWSCCDASLSHGVKACMQ